MSVSVTVPTESLDASSPLFVRRRECSSSVEAVLVHDSRGQMRLDLSILSET
jgi:hypothetical protein